MEENLHLVPGPAFNLHLLRDARLEVSTIHVENLSGSDLPLATNHSSWLDNNLQTPCGTSRSLATILCLSVSDAYSLYTAPKPRLLHR
ncbi:hypothetical protein GDO81_007010 [Engystomops pustulosus]|uniref:Uncharacterized protein n=1 Tax=Engystomops pustulosus TaxID=76066 RepID=A0AAV7D2W6_ENGPU|nr:hypothetical protein GDO81_007010 [Engystomops pustulosus]